ncbi:MAG TPA: ABC transporter substrate-binding protein [Pseudolabrys sp.]|jgi:NitT/TauT family transport system substrate-binding protein
MTIAKTRTLTLAAMMAVATIGLMPQPAAAQEKVWKHALLNAKADAGFLMMLDKGGFAAKQGLKLELLQVKDDQIGLKALIAGEVDSFEGGPQGVFAAVARGADIKIIGCHWVVLPHGIYVRDDIKTVEDLKGKSVAVSAPNSMPDMLARFALAKYGVTTDQVKLAAVGGDRERYQALAGGVVEGAVVSNEYQPGMPKNLHLLVAGRDAVPNFLRVCMVTSGNVLAERGDDAVHFLAAEMQALRFALSHKAETVALTKEIIRSKPDDPRPAFVYDDAVEHHAIDPDLPIPAEKLNWMQEQLLKAGKLKEQIPLAKISAPEYREKALKLVNAGH